jgi:hypothetical protein
MPVMVRRIGGLADIRFLAVPTSEELLDLADKVRRAREAEGRRILLVATITPGGLGALSPDARRTFMAEWKNVAASVAGAAVIIEGEGLGASITRSFVRGLSLALGRAWTLHPDRESAVRHLASLVGADVGPWIRLVQVEDGR